MFHKLCTVIVYQLCFHAGEFGIVYKASLKTSNRRVAVETLKGWHNIGCANKHWN